MSYPIRVLKAKLKHLSEIQRESPGFHSMDKQRIQELKSAIQSLQSNEQD